MAVLPQRQELATVAAMRAYWEAQPQRQGRRLGASSIGKECERRLWYGFRWANQGERNFDGRMLRLFNRGHREEPVFIAELRGAGVQVWDIDPATGEQFEFRACSGHFVAKIDGVALGVLDAPKSYHLLSFKTANAKGFAEIVKADRPGDKYEAQSQIEMRLAKIDRTLFLVANKDDDQVHGIRLRADEAAGERLEAKAERIIFAAEPGPRLSEDAAFYKCKQCPVAAVCHSERLPAVNCRTCLHATPERDGDGRWSCALAEPGNTIPAEFQVRGCGSHRYIPALLARWGAAVDASEQENWVEYEAADRFRFRNGAIGPGSFASSELRAASPAFIRDQQAMAIRGAGGVIVEREAA